MLDFTSFLIIIVLIHFATSFLYQTKNNYIEPFDFNWFIFIKICVNVYEINLL